MPAWTAVIALLFAFCLDRWFGEPVTRWHPVAWIARFLGWIGGRIAPREATAVADWRAFWAGALAWIGGAILVWLLAYVMQRALLQLPVALAGVLLGALLKPMLSWRRVRLDVTAVETALALSLDAGRRQLGRLVSREVMRLDEQQVREGAIASLAESLNDCVVAPVFWFLVGGLPGAVVYRFASTAHAMWGVRGFRAGSNWEWAGQWAARSGLAMAWVPARITALLIAALAGGLPYRKVRVEAWRAPSATIGWPLAAMALALRARLRRPGAHEINMEDASPTTSHTGRALRLADHTVAVTLAWTCLFLFLLAWERPW